VEKPEGRRPLGRTRWRWEDNIKIDLRKVGWGVMDWIYLAQDRGGWWALVKAVMNLQVPHNVGYFLTSSELVSFSRRTLLHGVRTCTMYTKHGCKQPKSDITKIPIEFIQFPLQHL
jgi:hypothetical protein